MVITLVTLAGASGSWELFSYSTVPVVTSMRTALFPASASVAAPARRGSIPMTSTIASTQLLRFIEIPPCTVVHSTPRTVRICPV